MGANRRQLIGGALAVAAVGSAADTQEARAGIDDEINDFVGNQNKTYWNNQPAHFYDYSAPRDVVIQLYDAIVPRMANTWTVFFVPGVGPVDVTPSKGYPIPYGSQLTNPEYAKGDTGDNGGAVTLPQPEPTGLYQSGDTSATWVLAVNEDGYVMPEYHEEMVTCYPFEVTIDPQTRTIVRKGQKVASVTVDLSRAGS